MANHRYSIGALLAFAASTRAHVDALLRYQDDIANGVPTRTGGCRKKKRSKQFARAMGRRMKRGH